MATQLEAFRMVAPEFDAESDTMVQNFLDLSPLYINPDIYPVESRGLAIVLKAASLMFNRKKSATGSSGGGAVVEEKEGDLMRKYATTADSLKAVDIYESQLNQLSLGIVGAGIMTRIGPYGT